MPWKVEKGHGCPASRPWAVVKQTDGTVEGCHPTKDAATQQQKALYAKEPTMASVNTDNPPRDNLVRAVSLADGAYELRDDDAGGMPTLVLRWAVFNTWTEINSLFEGRFLERNHPRSMDRTISEDRGGMRVLFQHGRDPQAADKPLGPIAALEAQRKSTYAEVPLLDTSYNRDLLPGLRAGLYGASYRFQVVEENWIKKPDRSDHNPEGLPERTIMEARVLEFGPVTFPAYEGATAGIRSVTDWYLGTTPDFTGRGDQRMAPGGDPDPTPGNGSGPPDPRAQHRALLYATRRRLYARAD